MKVLIYSNKQNLIKYSGVGRARDHQILALKSMGFDYTLNPRDDYDLIHINTVFFSSYLAAVFNRLRGKTVVYHAHSTEEDFRNSFKLSNLLSPLFKFWIMACYRKADLILTPSNYSKKLLRNYGIDKEIKVISNGIDLSYWKVDKKEKEDFRKKYGYTNSDKVIMCSGLLIKRKGIMDFIEFAEKMPQYKFIWFGTCNKSLIPKEVSDRIKSAPKNCNFAGYIKRDDMRVAYQAVDLFLFPSYEETEGIVLLEALASKVKTLVRNLPVFDDYEENKDIYKADSNDEFMDKIDKILNGELDDLTESGYKKVSEKSIENIGRQLVENYNEAATISEASRNPIRKAIKDYIEK